MKDEEIQKWLSHLMLFGVLGSAAIIIAGLVWYLVTHIGGSPGDHIFTGEPNYFTSIADMVRRACDLEELGHRRSVIMIGVVLLLLNPLLRVGFAAAGFAAQRDRLYTGVSLLVFLILLFSFFW